MLSIFKLKYSWSLITLAVAALLFFPTLSAPQSLHGEDEPVLEHRVEFPRSSGNKLSTLDSHDLQITEATVIRVVDGNTIVVKSDQSTECIRYAAIKAPEKAEPYYQESSSFNKDLVMGKTVLLQKVTNGADAGAFISAYVFLKDEDQTFVNAKLVEEGFAELAPVQFSSKYLKQLLALQSEARKAHKGIWKYENPASPRVFLGKSMWRDAANTSTSFVFGPIWIGLAGIFLILVFFPIAFIAGTAKKRRFVPPFLTALGLLMTIGGIPLGIFLFIGGMLAIVVNLAVPDRSDFGS